MSERTLWGRWACELTAWRMSVDPNFSPTANGDLGQTRDEAPPQVQPGGERPAPGPVPQFGKPSRENGQDEAQPLQRPGVPRWQTTLGPLITLEPLEGRVFGRLYAAGTAAAAIAILVTAFRLQPDPRELGTHRQLGLPPCGFYVMTGLPCPTCGMTTAFALAVRGRVVHAIQALAAGFVLALATMVVAGLGLFTMVTGRRVALNWYRLNPVRLIWLMSFGFLLAWGLKIGLELMNRGGKAGG